MPTSYIGLPKCCMVTELQFLKTSARFVRVGNDVHVLCVFLGSNRCVFIVYANNLCDVIFHSSCDCKFWRDCWFFVRNGIGFEVCNDECCKEGSIMGIRIVVLVYGTSMVMDFGHFRLLDIPNAELVCVYVFFFFFLSFFHSGV